MNQHYLPAHAGTRAHVLARLIARRAIPVGCALGIAVSGQALAVDASPGAKLGDEFAVDTSSAVGQASPEVARDAVGNFVVVWESAAADEDIFAQRYASDGSPDGDRFQVNTITAGDQDSPVVAMGALGNFVVVWEGDDASQEGVFARRFDGNGNPLDSSEFQVNTFTTNDQGDPSVAMDADGDFVVAWESNGQDGDETGIYAQRYNANGSVAGSEFRVNTETGANQRDPAVALDADGDFVVAWSGYGQGGDSYGIYAQRYTADGSGVGAEFQVNTETVSVQRDPVVAMDADGDFVVVWESYGQDGDEFGIYAQRYAANGSPAGDEFQVNTQTANVQRNPAISMDADGDFVVAWQGDNAQRNGFDVHAQRYSADGSPAGAEFLANTQTSGFQYRSSVAMDADGDFVVAWQSYAADDSDPAVFVQRFVGPEDVDLAVTITDNPDPVIVGNTLTYTLTLDNNHDTVAPTGFSAIDTAIGAATGLTGTAQLSGPGFTLLGIDPPSESGVTCAPGTAANSVVCSRSVDLVAGAGVSVGIRVRPDEAGTQVATANATGNQFDSNEGEDNDNNTDTEQTTVNATSGGDTGGPPDPTDNDGITSVGGSGGCALSATQGKPDPLLPGLAILAALVLMRRRLQTWLSQSRLDV